MHQENTTFNSQKLGIKGSGTARLHRNSEHTVTVMENKPSRPGSRGKDLPEKSIISTGTVNGVGKDRQERLKETKFAKEDLRETQKGGLKSDLKHKDAHIITLLENLKSITYPIDGNVVEKTKQKQKRTGRTLRRKAEKDVKDSKEEKSNA